jgi:hypothetical protein
MYMYMIQISLFIGAYISAMMYFDIRHLIEVLLTADITCLSIIVEAKLSTSLQSKENFAF